MINETADGDLWCMHGTIQLHLLRWEWEPDIGVTTQRDGKCFVVTSVREYGPAYRAGIEIGDRVRAYSLTADEHDFEVWSDAYPAGIATHPPNQVFTIKVKKEMQVQGVQATRKKFIIKKKVRSKYVE